MHDAVHLSGGSSSRPNLEPHHFADSTFPKRSSAESHINLCPAPAASSHKTSNDGRRDARFRERYALS